MPRRTPNSDEFKGIVKGILESTSTRRFTVLWGNFCTVMDRPGTPEDIAPVVIFLASEESGWIRGSKIPCDGGMSNHVYCSMFDL